MQVSSRVSNRGGDMVFSRTLLPEMPLFLKGNRYLSEGVGVTCNTSDVREHVHTYIIVV